MLTWPLPNFIAKLRKKKVMTLSLLGGAWSSEAPRISCLYSPLSQSCLYLVLVSVFVCGLLGIPASWMQALGEEVRVVRLNGTAESRSEGPGRSYEFGTNIVPCDS